MAASTLPTYRAALLTALGLRAGLAGVPVFAYHPGKVMDDHLEGIALTSANIGESPMTFRSGGGQNREEEYTITGLVWAKRTTLDYQTAAASAEDRARDLYDEVRDALTDDPTQGATVKYSHVVGAGVDVQPTVDGAALALYEFRIEQVAYI
jgi:hypothetical protein